jgi:hypothetical protein
LARDRPPPRATTPATDRPQRAGLSPADAARALNAAGALTTAEAIAEDIAAGAPTNEDGTLNLLHYTAWLARELVR